MTDNIIFGNQGMEFLYDEQLAEMKKNLQAHNERVGFHPASDQDIFYLQNCNIPESVVNYYRFAEPDDVVEISDSRIWPVSILKVENEKMEPGSLVFPLGYFVIGTTVFGDCYCLDLNSVKGKKTEPEVVLVSHDRTHFNTSVEEIVSGIQKISKSFSDFLTSFSKGKLKII